MKSSKENDWPLLRIIIPLFPEVVNIFSNQAEKTTPLGPIMVATSANKIWGLRVEVTDLNNYKGPRNTEGFPDHEVLQRERFASVVGIYCGLTSTTEHVFELAKFYKDQGAVIIAGGWHTHFCFEEALRNNIDIVVHGDGEMVIQDILNALMKKETISVIPGISFLENGQPKTNLVCMSSASKPDQVSLEVENLSHLPYPDFGLLRYVKKLKTYPISGIRGCRGKCEFCSVRGEPRWADAEHLFNSVSFLVDTRGAKKFFIVDDRLDDEKNIKGTLKFFQLIADKYGNSLQFSVQIRLSAATNTILLETMKRAGVKTVFIGFESAIDAELKAMRKGYPAPELMIKWARIFRKYFWVHGMFMFGWPGGISNLSVEEIIECYKRLIHEAGINSLQVLKTIPIVGTPLRARLELEGKLFSLEVVPWKYYDGNFPCFKPDNMTLEEFHNAPIKIMKWFYRTRRWKVVLRAVFLPVDLAFKGRHKWLEGWRSEVVRFAARKIIRKWHQNQDVKAFVSRLEKHGKYIRKGG
jgi:radical SAM superfamily enzyme YgiQ (UPF0313 family)